MANRMQESRAQLSNIPAKMSSNTNACTSHCSPDSTSFYQANYLAFGDNCVEEIEAPIFPLDRTIHIQRIAEPEIRGASVRGKSICLNMHS